MTIEFINDQFDAKLLWSYYSERVICMEAKDRRCMITRHPDGSTSILVHRYSNPPQQIRMSDKMYGMLCTALRIFEEAEGQHEFQNLAVQESQFEGDFLKPWEQRRNRS